MKYLPIQHSLVSSCSLMLIFISEKNCVIKEAMMKIKLICLRDFMCFNTERVCMSESSSIVSGPNSSGKSALLQAIQFIISPKFADEQEAGKLVRAESDNKSEAYVKIVFEITNGDDESKSYLISLRKFSPIDVIYYEYEDVRSFASVRAFQLKFNFISVPSETIMKNIDSTISMQSMNLMSCMNLDKKSNFEKACDENIEQYKALTINRKKESFTSYQKLRMEEKVLFMLWISKHYDHNRQVRMRILDEKRNSLPNEDDCKNLYSLEYYATVMEFDLESIADQQTRYEEIITHLTENAKELFHYKNQITGRLQSLNCSMNRYDETRREVLTGIYNTFKIVNSYLSAAYNLWEKMSNVRFQTFVKNTAQDQKNIDIKTDREFWERKKQSLKKSLHSKDNPFRKYKRILQIKKTRDHKFFNEIFKLKSDLDKNINTFAPLKYQKNRDLIYRHVYGMKSKIRKNHAAVLRLLLENLFSLETINAVDILVDIDKCVKHSWTIEIDVKYSAKRIIRFYISYKKEEQLPRIIFNNENDYLLSILCLKEKPNCYKVNCFRDDDDMNKILEEISGVSLFDQTTLVVLLEEWIVYCLYEKRVINFSPIFLDVADKSGCIRGGYQNVLRYQIYAQFIKWETYANNFDYVEEFMFAPLENYNCERLVPEKKIQRIFQMRKQYHTDEKLVNSLQTYYKSLPENVMTKKQIIQCTLEIRNLKRLEEGENFDNRIQIPLQSFELEFFNQEKSFNTFIDDQQKYLKQFLLEDDMYKFTEKEIITCELYDHVVYQLLKDSTILIREMDENIVECEEKRRKKITQLLEIYAEIRELKSTFQPNDEYDHELRRKLFPIDYDPEHLYFNDFERFIYEKNKNFDFFAINTKLKNVKDDIKFTKRDDECDNAEHNQFEKNLHETLSKTISLQTILVNIEKQHRLKIFLQLNKDINQIFKLLISRTDVCARFMIEIDNELIEINDSNFDLTNFKEIITYIQIGSQSSLWTAVESHLQFLLSVAVKIAVAANFDQPILIIENMDMLKSNQNFELVKSFIVRKYMPDIFVQDVVEKNYIQNIIDVCHHLKISVFMEYRDKVFAERCNIITCKKTSSGSKCHVDISNSNFV